MVKVHYPDFSHTIEGYLKAVLIGVFLCGSLPACALSPKEAQAEAVLRIEAGKPATNPLLIRVTLTMNAEGVCVFDTFSPAAGGIADWIVLGPDGNRLAYRGPEAKVDYRAIVRRLHRGEAFTATVDLFSGDGGEPYFDFSARGTYRIRLVWTMSPEWGKPEYRGWFPGCEPWSGSVSSNTLNITLGGLATGRPGKE